MKIVGVSLLVGAVIVVIGNSLLVFGKKQEEKYYQTCLDNGYDVYIDGVLVDSSKIELSDYNISVNDELKEMYLSPNKN